MNIPLKASQRSDVFSFLPISQHPTPVNKGKKSDWNIKVYHPCSNIVFNRQLHGRISQFLPHFLVWTSQFLPHFLVWTQHEDQPLNPEGQCKFEHDHLLLLESMLWSRTKAINTNKDMYSMRNFDIFCTRPNLQRNNQVKLTTSWRLILAPAFKSSLQVSEWPWWAAHINAVSPS